MAEDTRTWEEVADEEVERLNREAAHGEKQGDDVMGPYEKSQFFRAIATVWYCSKCNQTMLQVHPADTPKHCYRCDE